MSVLLDVNQLLACAWQSHARHAEAVAWLKSVPGARVCTFVELGFLRVSMGPAFRVSFATALQVLGDTKRRGALTALPGDLEMLLLPPLRAHSEVSDAYLVKLARVHGLRLATLDDVLCAKPWAADVAFNPLVKTVAP